MHPNERATRVTLIMRGGPKDGVQVFYDRQSVPIIYYFALPPEPGFTSHRAEYHYEGRQDYGAGGYLAYYRHHGETLERER